MWCELPGFASNDAPASPSINKVYVADWQRQPKFWRSLYFRFSKPAAKLKNCKVNFHHFGSANPSRIHRSKWAAADRCRRKRHTLGLLILSPGSLASSIFSTFGFVPLLA